MEQLQAVQIKPLNLWRGSYHLSFDCVYHTADAFCKVLFVCNLIC
jgi:hypothetical protein